jgi:hypothetical protein
MALDISEATIVTLYLLPESNLLLRPKLEAQLKPGTRIVSHNYSIEGWEEKELRSEISLQALAGRVAEITSFPPADDRGLINWMR